MSVSVTMPQLGESVTEGTVTRWLKQVGDTVTADEALLEVSTDKVDTEIPSPVAGVILSINAPEDTTLPVGGVLAIIGAAGGAPAAAPAAAAPAPVAATPVAPAAPAAAPVAAAAAPAATSSVAADNSDAYVTPLVRKLANENGVDLAQIKGTGIGGRIRKQDVLDAVSGSRPPQPLQLPLLLCRKLILNSAVAPRSSPACARSSPSAWSKAWPYQHNSRRLPRLMSPTS